MYEYCVGNSRWNRYSRKRFG